MAPRAHSDEGPRITVITSTLNCADALRTTAASIREQTWPYLQWIVADGASVDGTTEVIRENADVVSDTFSSRDEGVYDAWNKASAFIRGDWVIFLGAGDRFLSPTTLSHCAAKLDRLPESVVIGYGDVLVFRDGELVYRHGAVTPDTLQCYKPTTPCHQGVFQRADCFRRPRPFDDRYKVVADTKFMLEALRERTMVHIGEEVADMRTWGLSSHPNHTLRVMREFFELEKDLGYRVPLLNKAYFVASAAVKHLVYMALGGRPIHAVVALKQRLTRTVPRRRGTSSRAS